MADYFILTGDEDPQNCLVNECPVALDQVNWRIAKGERMGGLYPADVTLSMAKRHPGVFVPDFIFNTVAMPLVTAKLKVLLEREAGVEIEFLPFTLFNHKGRVAAEGCHIANVIGARDWADLKKTRGEKSVLKPGQFTALFQLQLDPAKVDSEARLFRLSIKPTTLIIRDDLRAAFEREGITGVKYIAMGERCRVL